MKDYIHGVLNLVQVEACSDGRLFLPPFGFERLWADLLDEGGTVTTALNGRQFTTSQTFGGHAR